MSIILDTDSYKFSHHLQNPPGTTRKWSYIEARGGAFQETMFFGLQSYLPRLRLPTMDEIDEADEIVGMHLGPRIFNRSGWMKMRSIGYVPLQIDAMSEGAIVPVLTPQVTVVNTHPDFAWLPAYIETPLIRAVWYGSTVATVSYHARRIIQKCFDKTSDHPELLPFKLHDFGARGVSSKESAGLGGVAHLVNFQGTDTVEALLYARQYYGCKMAGFSIPAAEHSTITAWGKDREAEFVNHMIDTFARPGRLVAVVGDSYSIWNFTQNVLGQEFADRIAKTGGTLVERPDSGNPVDVPIDVIKSLMKTHGFSTNSKGFAVLPDYIRVIQGDGMDIGTIERLCNELVFHGIAIDNIAFGMGGGLLQKLDRDTLKYAMKTSAIEIDSHVQEVSKKPITDPGKASKAGIQVVAGGRPVFRNGTIHNTETLDTIRQRVTEHEASR